MNTQEDTSMDINQIMSIIPHRYPFLLIDRIKEIILGESIIGIKNVTFNEPQFTGHFPSRPIMPGVLIIEAMAQLSAVLVAKSMETTEDKEVFFMSIEDFLIGYLIGEILQLFGFVLLLITFIRVLNHGKKKQN